MAFTEEEKAAIMQERLKNWELDESTIQDDVETTIEMLLKEIADKHTIEKLQVAIMEIIHNRYGEE